MRRFFSYSSRSFPSRDFRYKYSLRNRALRRSMVCGSLPGAMDRRNAPWALPCTARLCRYKAGSLGTTFRKFTLHKFYNEANLLRRLTRSEGMNSGEFAMPGSACNRCACGVGGALPDPRRDEMGAPRSAHPRSQGHAGVGSLAFPSPRCCVDTSCPCTPPHVPHTHSRAGFIHNGFEKFEAADAASRDRSKVAGAWQLGGRRIGVHAPVGDVGVKALGR